MRRRAPTTLILLLALVAAAAALTLPAAAAAQRPPSLLEKGSHGPRVAALQWLLGGHRPSAYLGISTFQWKPNGLFGDRTARSVVAMKSRLGFPDRELRPVAGTDLIEILTGRRPRPLGYIRRASERLQERQAFLDRQASSACALRAIRIARGELGVHEQPDGSNDGSRIRDYQAVTGAFRAPWCASFVQWVLKSARIGFVRAWKDRIAENSAGVFYIADWARRHGWLRAIPKPGYLVAFVDHLGHIGLVESVLRGGIVSVEGNSANAVRERSHPYGSRPMVFIRVPGCAGG